MMKPKDRIKAGIRDVAHVSTVTYQHMDTVVYVFNVVVSTQASCVVVTGIRKGSVIRLLRKQGIGHTMKSGGISIGYTVLPEANVRRAISLQLSVDKIRLALIVAIWISNGALKRPHFRTIGLNSESCQRQIKFRRPCHNVLIGRTELPIGGNSSSEGSG